MARVLHLTQEPQYHLLEWARTRCGVIESTWPPESEAVAVMEGDRIRAVMVLNTFCGASAILHFASDHTRTWATRNTLAGLLGYCFLYKRLSRLQLAIPVSKRPAIIAGIKLGFQFEGIARGAGVGGEDIVSLSMLKGECKWIREADHGRQE